MAGVITELAWVSVTSFCQATRTPRLSYSVEDAVLPEPGPGAELDRGIELAQRPDPGVLDPVGAVEAQVRDRAEIEIDRGVRGVRDEIDVESGAAGGEAEAGDLAEGEAGRGQDIIVRALIGGDVGAAEADGEAVPVVGPALSAGLLRECRSGSQ